MSSFYFYNCHIDASMVDNHAYLRMDGIFNILQTMLTEYLKQYKADNISIKDNFNAAWLITKVLVKINKMPLWGTNITVKSYVVQKKSAKIILETIAKDKDENILFVAHDEMCPINLEKRRILRLTDIEFDPILLESNYLDNFEIISNDNMKLSDSFNVKYIDIDFTNHTNNVSYIRYIVNDLGLDFFEKYNITKIDVRYLAESRINDKLSILKNDNGNDVTLLIKNDDKDVFLIKIDYINK